MDKIVSSPLSEDMNSIVPYRREMESQIWTNLILVNTVFLEILLISQVELTGIISKVKSLWNNSP